MRYLAVAGLTLAVVVGCGGQTVTVTTTAIFTETTTAQTETVTQTIERSPPSKGVKISYGQWAELFKIHGARMASQFGSPTVLGQFEYLGGGDCDLGLVNVEATFFDRSGKIVDTGLWNTEAPPKGTRLPMSILAVDAKSASRAEIVVTQANCA